MSIMNNEELCDLVCYMCQAHCDCHSALSVSLPVSRIIVRNRFLLLHLFILYVIAYFILRISSVTFTDIHCVQKKDTPTFVFLHNS